MVDAIAQDRLAVYKSMKLIRLVEEEIAKRYHEQEMRCPVHLSIGQEAVAVAVAGGLRHDDFVISTHRSHAHYLAKGGDLVAMIAEIYGKKSGCCLGVGGSMHLFDQAVGFMGSTAIVGGGIPVAVGLGLSLKLKGTDQLSCVFLGDGAVEEGVFYESLNFAALKQLPVLFVCENNLYSVNSPLRPRQPPGRSIAAMVNGIGVKAMAVDGNKVMENRALIESKVNDMRQGSGPFFIEFSTYRWMEHCGPGYDFELGVRPKNELEAWRASDPLVTLRDSLIADGLRTGLALDEVDKVLLVRVRNAFQEALSAPACTWSQVSQLVYR